MIRKIIVILLLIFTLGGCQTKPVIQGGLVSTGSTPYVISTEDLGHLQGLLDALKAGQSISLATPVVTFTPTFATTSTNTVTPVSTFTVTPTFTQTVTPTTVTSTPIPASNYYYVSLAGNDQNSGTFDSPWRTFSKATKSVQPGNTVYIRGGTYTEQLSPTVNGTASNYITFAGYPGEVTTLSVAGISVAGKNYIRLGNLNVTGSTTNCVSITNSTYIEVNGLNVSNCNTRGIYVSGGNQITISNNKVNHITLSSGIAVWNSTNILVDGNTITNAHWYHECQGAYDEALTISVVDHFVVSNNTLDNTEANPTGFCNTYSDKLGIDVKESSQNGLVFKNKINHMTAAGLYVDGWLAGSSGTPTLNHIDLYQNTLNETGGILVGDEQSVGVVEYINIYNNLVLDSYFSGIQVTGAWGDGLRKNIKIYNNTVYGADIVGGNGGAGIYVTTAHLASNNTDKPIIIKDNISMFYFLNVGSAGTVGQIRAGNSTMSNLITADHNIVYAVQICSQSFPNCIEVGQRISSTPSSLFIDPTNFDLHLKVGSPAISNGDLFNNLIVDFDGLPKGLNIGAYSFHN